MKYQFRIIGIICTDPVVRLAYTSAARRLGASALAVGPEEEDAFEVFDDFCDAIVVEDLNMGLLFARKKPILVASTVDVADIPKAVEELLYNS